MWYVEYFLSKYFDSKTASLNLWNAVLSEFGAIYSRLMEEARTWN